MSENYISLKEHQNIMLKLLIEFDNYCTKNNLRYYLARGTLLGGLDITVLFRGMMMPM